MASMDCYSGHVVNLPQDVLLFATNLQTLPFEIDILVVKKEKDQVHQDFHVRRRVVQQALNWLLENNCYYRANQVCMNAEALEQLPEDGNLSSLMSVQPEPSTAPQGSRPSEEDPATSVKLICSKCSPPEHRAGDCSSGCPRLVQFRALHSCYA